MNEPNDNSVQKIWQSQPVEVTNMSAEMIRKRASKFERRIWWRNAREYVASLIVIAVFGSSFVKTHGILHRIAFGLLIAGTVWIVIQLHRKGSARNIPMEADTSTSLRLYRAELERQRDALNSVWQWYLAPLVPGFVVVTLAHAIAHPGPLNWAKIALFDAVSAALFFGIWKMNLRAARHLQGTIDELNGGH